MDVTYTEQQCNVSSPAAERRWNSLDSLPPIAPELAATRQHNQSVNQWIGSMHQSMNK